MDAPRGEIGWTAYFDESGCQDFLMTTKSGDRRYYYLYKIENDKAIRLERSTDPTQLEAKYIYPKDKQTSPSRRRRSSATQSKK